MQDLKERAAQLQDKLADQHAEFSQSGTQQADPAAAASWQEQWQAQARQVSEVQDTLKRDQVMLSTHDTLAGAERAAGQLEQQLQDLKQAGSK